MRDKLKSLLRWFFIFILCFILIYVIIFVGGWKLFESGDPILIEMGVALVLSIFFHIFIEIAVKLEERIKSLEERIAQLESESDIYISLRDTANTIISFLNEMPVVKSCSIYGSLAMNEYDEMSDIDIEIDVSGYDNGQFMLEVVELLKGKIDIYYSDYATSLIPDKYIVSIAIDKKNPFLIADLCCKAKPHCTSVTKQQVLEKNEKYTHILKLWTANLKHHVRGKDCCDDIVRMGKKIGIEDIEVKDDAEILEQTLCWLEENVEDGLYEFIESCRRKFDELVNQL